MIMKKLHFLALLPVAMLLANCGDDDNKTVNKHPELAHAWSLTNVSGSIAGISKDYEPGTIIWNFNTNNSIITVVNNNTDESAPDALDSGVYSYHFVENEITPATCSESIEVNESNLGCTSVNGNTLIISMVESDGYQLTFTKMPVD